MPAHSSSDIRIVSDWVRRLKHGDGEAAMMLWHRYSKRMLSLSRRRLRATRPTAFDEEDVALSAFHAFCAAVKDGKFSQTDSRDDLWPLLATITNRKANDRLKSERAAKRSQPAEPIHSSFEGISDDSVLSKIADPEMGPEVQALMAEQCQRLLGVLGDPELEQIVVLKLEGFTNDEVAVQMKRTRRTIQRMLSLIRDKWQVEMDRE